MAIGFEYGLVTITICVVICIVGYIVLHIHVISCIDANGMVVSAVLPGLHDTVPAPIVTDQLAD